MVGASAPYLRFLSSTQQLSFPGWNGVCHCCFTRQGISNSRVRVCLVACSKRSCRRAYLCCAVLCCDVFCCALLCCRCQRGNPSDPGIWRVSQQAAGDEAAQEHHQGARRWNSGHCNTQAVQQVSPATVSCTLKMGGPLDTESQCLTQTARVVAQVTQTHGPRSLVMWRFPAHQRCR
jgi:hypothetical protein